MAANVYSAGQVNTRQQAEVVNILAVLPAKVKVSNAQNQRADQIVDGLLGALAGASLAGLGHHHHYALANGTVGALGGGLFGTGSLVPGEVLVDGVSITYVDHGSTFNSAQVGRLCEYRPGQAIMVATSPSETRIQPNTTCPVPTHQAWSMHRTFFALFVGVAVAIPAAAFGQTLQDQINAVYQAQQQQEAAQRAAYDAALRQRQEEQAAILRQRREAQAALLRQHKEELVGHLARGVP